MYHLSVGKVGNIVFDIWRIARTGFWWPLRPGQGGAGMRPFVWLCAEGHMNDPMELVCNVSSKVRGQSGGVLAQIMLRVATMHTHLSTRVRVA